MIRKFFSCSVVLLVLLVASRAWAEEKLPGFLPVSGKVITHTVVAGEDLWAIARHYDLAMDHIMMANGMSGLAVKPGQKLLIPKMFVLPAVVDDGLVVNLPERLIYQFKDGELEATYPCAVGRGGRFATPTGSFKILNLQANPTWFPPTWAHIENPIPPGPSNPLGDRWIGLSADGVGMHATNDPMSIGQVISHGCMRMYPWHARALFDSVKVGQSAQILYEPVKIGFNSEDHNIYISVFPDIYGQIPNLLEYTREKLDKLGLLPLVDDARLKSIVDQRAGVPQSIVGSDIVIKVNDRRSESTLAPILRNGQIWVPSQFFRDCGMQIHFEDQQATMVIVHDYSDVHLSLEPSTATTDGPNFTPVRWRGQTIVPLSPILAALNVTTKWDAPHKTFLIYMKQMEARR